MCLPRIFICYIQRSILIINPRLGMTAIVEGYYIPLYRFGIEVVLKYLVK